MWRHSLLVDARPGPPGSRLGNKKTEPPFIGDELATVASGVSGSLAHELLPALEANYRDWVRTHYHAGARRTLQRSA